ncbi:MAG: glycogen synthase GlgA [Candidatus Omnitrophica bacterium]|nr:glycogen synthase GlgA [Candidatus Omnitrophota bacterium]
MRIAMFASEVVPFAKTGGLADVVGALPLPLERLKHEIIVIMPFYKKTKAAGFKIEDLNSKISTTTIGKKIKVYFIKKEEFFNRPGLYGEKEGDFPDNLNRFSYFCREALKLLKEIEFRPQILHCHDWQSSLVPVYLKTTAQGDEFYKGIKTLLTIHNLAYQGLFNKEEFPKLGLDWSLFNMEALEFYGKVNLLKAGIVFSDAINTVSPTYAKEIQTKEFGCGLEGVLIRRRDNLFGILNGLDYQLWNPKTDKFILKNYDKDNIEGKVKNKEALCKLSKLPSRSDIPLLGIVSRLTQQKGFDILSEAMEEICSLPLQLVILGTGELNYHRILERLARKFPKKLRTFLKFDNVLAHKIYAGCDIFLMPSKYEPCGLGQMISLKYGTIPLVFKTGGLTDTIDKKNGFIFDQYSPSALVAKIKEMLLVFKDKNRRLSLMKRGMGCNFSWTTAARNYIGLYHHLLK